MGVTDADLPAGPWRVLLRQALCLLEQVERFGGHKPFFTFGGGTVLMLRYNHRLSKDIDLFVPDPQYLGFVTPRLSDMADQLCNSQYVEGPGFVKLQFPEGEIDFVASPNLLANADAYDEWQLFGTLVRAEKAAEIVAKKMFFRGNQATARDLFDFALVAEREPQALGNCEPFMMRNLDAFRNAVRSPTEIFVQRFRAIETLAYRPSFDDARWLALRYLDELAHRLEMSRQAAEQHAAAIGGALQKADVASGDYRGALVHGTDHHIVQASEHGTVIVHERFRLPSEVRCIVPGTIAVRLRYRNGTASVINSEREGGPGQSPLL